MIAYLDSSAIVKAYLPSESGREALESFVDSSVQPAVARLTYAEVRSALAAARRSGRLSVAEHDRAVRSFDSAWNGYAIVELDERVGKRAGEAVDTFGLRAADAVQLASALELDRNTTVIVAWDRDLRSAGQAAGLAVFPAAI